MSQINMKNISTTLQFFNENPIETNVEIETIPQYKNTNEYSDVTLENSDITDIAKQTNLSIEDSNVDFSLQDLESNQQDVKKTPDQDAPIKYSFTPLNDTNKTKQCTSTSKGKTKESKVSRIEFKHAKDIQKLETLW